MYKIKKNRICLIRFKIKFNKKKKIKKQNECKKIYKKKKI